MKLTINTDVLKKYNLSLGQFLILLLAYKEESYLKCYSELRDKGLIEPNLFEEMCPIVSNNTKDLVAKILMESDDRAVNSGIDFEKLANILINQYPTGNKTGTTYPWCASVEDIAQKLRTLVVKYNFTFTEEEAINAVIQYVESFKDYRFMHLLQNFLLKTTRDEQGHLEIDSMFMTIIENNREKDDTGESSTSVL